MGETANFRCVGCNIDYGIAWRMSLEPELCERCVHVTERIAASKNDQSCPWCTRLCTVCGYIIDGGTQHVQQPQPEGASHTICELRRDPVSGPTAKVIGDYFTHQLEHLPPKPIVVSPL